MSSSSESMEMIFSTASPLETAAADVGLEEVEEAAAADVETAADVGLEEVEKAAADVGLEEEAAAAALLFKSSTIFMLAMDLSIILSFICFCFSCCVVMGKMVIAVS